MWVSKDGCQDNLETQNCFYKLNKNKDAYTRHGRKGWGGRAALVTHTIITIFFKTHLPDSDSKQFARNKEMRAYIRRRERAREREGGTGRGDKKKKKGSSMLELYVYLHLNIGNTQEKGSKDSLVHTLAPHDLVHTSAFHRSIHQFHRFQGWLRPIHSMPDGQTLRNQPPTSGPDQMRNTEHCPSDPCLLPTALDVEHAE